MFLRRIASDGTGCQTSRVLTILRQLAYKGENFQARQSGVRPGWRRPRGYFKWLFAQTVRPGAV